MAGVTTSSVAGIVAGRNPLEYSSGSPYTLFLFQAIFIMIVCQLVHYPLKKIQQPRVIAEVLTGIILGPTVLGQIPDFSDNCFPTESKPGLVLMANVGIILFLFIVGLEVDLIYIKKNARAAFTVGFINMAIPFALGCGIARGLYDRYGDSSLKFSTYMVFIAVAMCITAFPVLARILVELNLIGDKVGTIVLSAGIINDLTGWILLALVVTLANAGSGVNTVYILLLTLAWFLLLLFPMRKALNFYLRRFTNEMVTGNPSQLLMVLIIILVFTSAFFTDIIGVHPIFGAFMVGVIIPRDNGYVVRITEKLEDLVHIVMIPVYFAVAGLSVDLGELNQGIDWAYVVGIILLAMVGKIVGGIFAAKLNGLLWRESMAVGVLMSCKGIVEIVVLNVGLNANIISKKVYSMFIVMALVTTFLTTPLALWIYPAKFRQLVSNWGPEKELDSEDSTQLLQSTTELSKLSLDRFRFSAIVLLLSKIESISHLMLLLKDIDTDDCEVKGLHFREFTLRTSHLLEASTAGEEANSTNEQDYVNSVSILAIVRAFSSMLNIKFTAKSQLAPIRNYVAHVNDQISGASDFLLTAVSTSSCLQAAEEADMATNYKQLLEECKSHVGVLMCARPARIETSKTIRLVINHNDRLTTSDLLALHLVRQLVRVHHDVHVFVRSSTGPNKEFELQFVDHVRIGEDVYMEVTYFKEFEDIESAGQRKENSFADDLFVVTSDFMDANEVAMVRFALRGGFDTLVVRAA